MRQYPLPLVALAALLGACAPAVRTPGGRLIEPTPSVSSNSSGTTVRLNPDDPRMASQLRATPAQVWEALPAVYAELGIEPDLVDPAKMTLGSGRFTASQIGGRRTGSYVRCGNEGSAASSMNRQRYRLTVMTSLQPSGSGTTVTTRVEGSANAVDASNASATYCASTGQLEQRITQLLLARVGA